MRGVRVLLCDGSPVLRAGMRFILSSPERIDPIEVVGDAGSLPDALDLIERTLPDVVIAELTLADGDRGAIATLRAATHTAILAFTDRRDRGSIGRAFEDGANGYLLKDALEVDLIHAVLQIAHGERFLDPQLDELTIPEPSEEAKLSRIARPGPLSQRELEVLRLLALGFTNSEVAEDLVISIRTAETHRKNILQKLGVRSRAELARAAWAAGLLSGRQAIS